MLSTPLYAIQLLIFLRTISAAPLPLHQPHARRSTSSKNIGSGFAIAICILFLAAIFYYLGMRHEHMKSWFGKRNMPTQSKLSRGFVVTPEGQRHKRQISCPLAVSSSAPIKPYDDPIEAPTPSLRCYEMPVDEIHEMGLPSPKKPPPRGNRLSLDRKPWWLKYAEDKQGRGREEPARTKSMPSWFKSVKGSNTTTQGEALAPPASRAYGNTLEVGCVNSDDSERASRRSSLLDWSGLDHVRRFYVERKSRVGF